MTPEEIQLARFKAAIELLGGTRSAAAAIGITERTINRMVAGQSKVHVGILKDLANALLEHADKCRKLERLIAPDFTGNLTREQLEKPPHGHSYHLRRED